MGTQRNMFSKLLELVKSWIPLRTEPAYVSRDFWMPDNSCRVCYDCDAQFTFFVRKHHCRLCGRVFCGNCTANSVPVPSADPKNRILVRDRVRVCNFCLQQWQQEVAAASNAIQMSNYGMDHSFSTASIVSTRSSDSLKTCTLTASSMSYSNEPYKRVLYRSAPSSVQSVIIEPGTNKQDIPMLGMNVDPAADVGSTCSNHFSYTLNKSDFYDDVCDVCHSDSEAYHFQHCVYYGHAVLDEIDQDYGRNKVNHTDQNLDPEEVFSLVSDSTKSQDSSCSDKVTDAEPEHGSYYCVSSSIYDLEDAVEPVDFENNGLLWLPPEPEDEEDDNDSLPNDNDDEYATKEWGHLRFSKSFGNGEFRTRDLSNDEHRRTMKNVVGGHFRALIAQLLQVENLPIGDEGDKESWLEIITSLSWEAATLLKPDMSRGGGMDPGGYVKVKCIACGHRNQSVVVRGVVFKKNVAHRHMMSNIEEPSLLILGGALDYQRVLNSLSSFDTLLQQEMDHLKMAVARIDSQRPHVLLVEKSVSRFAQDYLLAKNISLVLNVKRPLLERISRCTGAQIVPSIDHLSSPRLGHCDRFHVEKFMEEHGSAGQEGRKMMKTLMFFEECPRPLGCTPSRPT